MDIQRYQRADLPRLFEYWQKVGVAIPYFFPVSAERWQTCLLEDTLDGEATFYHLKTYWIAEQDHILGFGQWGQPTFIYEKGQKASTDQVGVIRHLYFDPGRDDVGAALLRQAREDLAGLCEIYAFYHIFGMSCNARHGKLHSSQAHVEQLLRAAGFDIEHENEYYRLDMKKPMVFKSSGEQKGQLKHVSDEHFELWQGGERVGAAQVQWLDKLTGGWTRDAVYLSWLGIAECTRGQGLGTEFLRMIGDRLRESGYRYLHTDTAQSNEKAQSLYERLGFESKGSTRSYVWNQNMDGGYFNSV